MSDLQGIRVALVEGRMSGELAHLVHRHGGEPYSVPAVREVARQCGEEVEACINRLARGAGSVVVFFTGVGVRTLCQEAARLGRLPELQQALRRVTTVCRGPKPTAALKAQGIQISINTPSPYTASELLQAMAVLDLTGREVTVVHYGERSAALVQALRARRARVEELCLYEWLLPEDTAPLHELIRNILAGRVDAIAFTSKVQVRHLWQVATEAGRAETLTTALRTKLIVAAVGPTSTAALEAVGVTPHVVPAHPKMGPMIVALATYLEQHGTQVRRGLKSIPTG